MIKLTQQFIYETPLSTYIISHSKTDKNKYDMIKKTKYYTEEQGHWKSKSKNQLRLAIEEDFQYTLKDSINKLSESIKSDMKIIEDLKSFKHDKE